LLNSATTVSLSFASILVAAASTLHVGSLHHFAVLITDGRIQTTVPTVGLLVVQLTHAAAAAAAAATRIRAAGKFKRQQTLRAAESSGQMTR
jgi:hypothetical protein